MTRTFFFILFFCGLTGCRNSVNLKTADFKNTAAKNNPGESISTHQLQLVSDSVRKIIDELNLCEYSDFLCYNKTKDCCYADDISHIRNIKAGDNSYENFIFQAPGGSGGGSVIVFCKRNGKYQKVQEENAYIDSILTTVTKGFHDLALWHRAHNVDGELALYKWNGEKYEKNKLLTDNKQGDD